MSYQIWLCKCDLSNNILIRRCSECAAMGVCGWCIYDNECTGSKILCPTLADWRGISVQVYRYLALTSISHDILIQLFLQSGSDSGCPALLMPKHGLYLQSVGVSNKLELYTRNLPLLVRHAACTACETMHNIIMSSI